MKGRRVSTQGLILKESSSSQHQTMLLSVRSSTGFIITSVCVAAFSDAFTYGVIIPVFPYSLKTRFGVPDEDIQYWNSTLLFSFGLAQFIFAPVFGHFADRSETRRFPLLLGFVGNALATALLYLARNVWMLVLSRFLQGLSAALVYTVGFALVADTVGQDNIGQWMGLVLSSLNVGMMISPTIGGILYDTAGYESIFIAVFALVAIDVIFRLFIIEKKVASKLKQKQALLSETTAQYGTFVSPELNASSSTTDISTASLGTESGPSAPANDSLSSPNTSNGTTHPLITLVKSPRVLISMYGALVTVTVLVAYDAVLPIFVAQQFGWSATGGGLIFLAISLPTFASPLAGKLADRYQNPLLAAFWFALSGGLVISLCLVTSPGLSPLAQKILLCILLTLDGFARTFGSSPQGADLSRAVARLEEENPGVFGGKDATAQAYSLYTSASALGVLVGPTWAAVVFDRWGWNGLMLSLGILSASFSVFVVLLKPNESSKKLQTPGEVPELC